MVPMKPGFAPINDDHAIERVVFTLELDRPLTSAAAHSLATHHSVWRNELPAMKRPDGLSVDLGPQGIRTDKMPGVEFAFLQPDGSPTWALKAQANEIIIECRRYSRWKKVWGKALSLFLDVAPFVDDGGTPFRVTKASLVVQDVFLNKNAYYDLRELFSKNSIVPTRIYEAGADWHVHMGWFDKVSAGRVLHNINLDGVSAQQSNSADGVNRVSILHFQQWLPDDVRPIGELNPDDLGKVMESLHQNNKAHIGEILVQEMSENVSLWQGEEH